MLWKEQVKKAVRRIYRHQSSLKRKKLFFSRAKGSAVVEVGRRRRRLVKGTESLLEGDGISTLPGFGIAFDFNAPFLDNLLIRLVVRASGTNASGLAW